MIVIWHKKVTETTDTLTGEDDFARNENKEHNTRFYHSVNETRKQLRFVARELTVCQNQTFKSN